MSSYVLIQVCNRYARAHLWVSSEEFRIAYIDEYVIVLRNPVLINCLRFGYFVHLDVRRQEMQLQRDDYKQFLLFNRDHILEIRRPRKDDYKYYRTFNTGVSTNILQPPEA